MSQHLMHSLDRPSGTVSRFGTESPIPTWDVLVQERLCGTPALSAPGECRAG